VSYAVLGVIVLIILLIIILVIAVKVSLSRGRKVKELEGALEAAQTERRRQGEYQHKKEEAQHHADEKKETLHTGNTVTDFDNSIGVLHGASKNRGH
jgi:predicted Holliday junction resolvase-like endonuclease